MPAVRVLNLEAVDLTQLFRRVVLIGWCITASAVLQVRS
jgi:hypothetical protein